MLLLKCVSRPFLLNFKQILHIRTIQKGCFYNPRLIDRSVSSIRILPSRTISNSSIAMAEAGGNRLRLEKSPYLLQHAGNPIDWFAFGDEAINKAKAEDKPIFLSVGYATCHWCHVMEKESFESPEIAAIMNEHFVAIKVDREERPDIDKIYMKFLLMISRSGGWPMNVWLTPDLTPITAGTYFPPESRWGVPAFKTVLLHIANKWKSERTDLLATGKTVIRIMQKSVDGEGEEEAEEGARAATSSSVESKFKEALKVFQYTFDKEWGGFNGAPKFPEVAKLNFLLHGFSRTGILSTRQAVTRTLHKIATGGIHDHVFGGFSRYAVDRKWHVPHFEKMLYDQGQLMSIYANTFKVTQDPFYLTQCEKTFDYLETDLRHPGGAFYSGEDADSLPTAQSAHKIEGSFYAWTHGEIQDLFETAREKFPKCDDLDLHFRIFCDHFDVREEGNVTPENDPHGHFVEKNILFIRGSVEETKKKYPSVDVEEVIRVGCSILHEERKTRPRPELDTKLICAWNGLMLTGLSNLVAISTETEKREKYLKAAQQLVDFAKEHFYCGDSKTLQRSCYGMAENLAESRRISGFLDDYAFLIRGLLTFYQVTLDTSVLEWAKELQESQDRLFWDSTTGGYFYTEAGAANVVLRLKEDHDGAEPCGNSVSVTNLLLLAEYFDDEGMKGTARKCVDFFMGNGSLGYPMPEMLCGAELLDTGLDSLVIVGPTGEGSERLLRVAQQKFVPGLAVFHVERTEDPGFKLKESVKSYKMVDGKATAYLCHNGVCQLPITEAKELGDSLNRRNEN